MKKLLSILASVAVAGSSASAVVACAPQITNKSMNNNQPAAEGDGGYLPNDGNSAPDAIPNSDNNGSSNHNQNKPSKPNTISVAAKDEAKVRDNAQIYAQKKILQDQYGIDGNYLDSEMGINNPETTGSKAIGMNEKGKYGADKYPLIDFLYSAGILKDSDISKSTLEGTILPMLLGPSGTGADGIDIPNPAQLGSLISSLMPLLPTLLPTIKGAIKNPEKIKATADGSLTPQVAKIIDELIGSGNTLDSKYDNLKVGDAMKSVLIGAAYIMAKVTDDNGSLSKFSDLATLGDSKDPDANVNAAIKYLIQGLTDIINSPKLSKLTRIQSTKDLTTLTFSGGHITSDMQTSSVHYGISYQSKDGTIKSLDDAVKQVNKGESQDDSGKWNSDNDTVAIGIDSNFLKDHDGTYVLTYKVDRTKTINSPIVLQFDVKKGVVDNKSFKALASALLTPDTSVANLTSQQDINVYTDMAKLLGMYIESFDKYKLTKGADNNHVFAYATDEDGHKAGEPMANYAAIKEVRDNTISSQNYTFNILKFLNNISYYLGKLDDTTGSGIYRLQAFLAMFLVDDDKSSASQFLLNWDNNAGADGWTNEIDGESANMTPISKLIYQFMDTYLSANEPETMKSMDGLLSALGFSWPDIVEMAKHNVYVLAQSMAWNRGFKFSNEAKGALGFKMNYLDDGLPFALNLVLPFDGLKKLPQWQLVEDDGVLNYLFGGNVYELLNEVATNKSMQKTYDRLNTYSAGLKKTIIGGIQSLMTMMAPYTSQVALNETINLTDEIGKYKKVEFKTANGTSVLNTELKGSKENKVDWGTSYSGPYDAPEIDNVIADSYNSSTNTTDIYIHALHIYQGAHSTMDDFGRTLKLNKNNISATRIGSDNDPDGNSYLKQVTYKATVSGKVTQDMTVSGSAERYMGSSGFFGTNYHWATGNISNSFINTLWDKDELGMSDILSLNLSADWRSTKSFDLSMAQIQKLAGLTITGYNGNDKGTSLRGKTDPVMGKSLNMQSVAAWSLSSLLGVVGLVPFSYEKTPLGLPVADNNSVGSLILEIGNLINTQDLNDLTKYMNLDRFQYLVNVVFGTDDQGNSTGQGNIVSRLIDAITGDKNQVTSKLSDILGLAGQNTYTKKGLIGALMMAFTKHSELIGADTASTTIMGNVNAESPMWDYLVKTLQNSWIFVDNNDNKKVIAKINDISNFNWDDAWEGAVEENGKIILTVNYEYQWQGYHNDLDEDGNVVNTTPVTETKKGSYTLTISDIKKAKQVYEISKN